METLIQINGIRYACPEADIPGMMASLERQKPEVLLVAEHTHDFGTVVRALVGTQCRGVVCRFDLPIALGMMHHDGTSVLVGRVAETDADGQCYCVRISGDYPTPSAAPALSPDPWAAWRWTGGPLMDAMPDDRQLDISLKVALAEPLTGGRIDKTTLLEHIDIVLRLARWDVSRETQARLSQLRRLLAQHPDHDIRSLAPRLRHTLAALGSHRRAQEFQDIRLPELLQSTQAKHMQQQWRDIHKARLADLSQWENHIRQQISDIDHCLIQLPHGLCYQKDHFGTLMHRLLYLDIPSRQLQMLLSAIVLKQRLKQQLGLTDNPTSDAQEQELLRLAAQLSPIFYGKPEAAQEFVLLAKDQKSTAITQLANQWMRQKRLNPTLCHRPLWTILHAAGIYTATESNWNAQLNIRKSWA